MDRLWTPWRYQYITGSKPGRRKGVPEELDGWTGEDAGCVFCNLIRAVDWATANGMGAEEAERHGLIVGRMATGYVCLNRYPYSSGHVLLVPYRHTGSLAALEAGDAEEMIQTAQRVETSLQEVYQPDGVNLGMNLGEAAGAGVAGHLHMHVLPRWFGDTNFMTVTGETRVLPELLEESWRRLRGSLNGSVTGNTTFPLYPATK